MRPFLPAFVGLMSGALSACSTAPTPPIQVASNGALPTMERVARGAHQCWFKSGDPAFQRYRMAMELNSFVGRPRILLVRAHSPETRPLLVVQAEGSPARLDAFGPMMVGPGSDRIRTDVHRWAKGSTDCS